MQKILISRCLLGHKVRYDGGASGPFDQLAVWQAEGRVVAIARKCRVVCQPHDLPPRSQAGKAWMCGRAVPKC